MYKLVTNDSAVYALSILPFEASLEKRGVQKKVLCIAFGPEIDTLAKVKEICTDELKTAVLTFYEDSNVVREEKEYTILEQIVTSTVTDEVGNEVEVLMAKMSKATTIPEQIAALEEEVKALTEENVELKESMSAVSDLQRVTSSNTSSIEAIEKTLAGVNEDELDLDGLKEYRISQSKVNLANYLSTHTVTSDAHKGVEAEYSMTQDKQNQLVAVIMMATMNPEYQPSWNASGEVCTYDWTLDELQALAAAIEAEVRPLVTKQQTMEVSIREAETIEAVKAIAITF